MSAAVVVAVVVIAVFLVGVAASLCWRRYKKSRERAELEEWAESQLGTGSLINHDSLSAVTPTDPSRIRFTMYRNPHHGFALEYPANWRCSQSPSPSESLVAHFSCPDSEPSFKRLSVGPLLTQPQVIQHLPTAVRGSQVLMQRPVQLPNCGDAHEIVYVITDDDGALIKLLNVATVVGRRAFTLTFSVAETDFDEYVPLARRMVDSFRVDAPASPTPETATETATAPRDVEWRELVSDSLRLAVAHPAHWLRDPVGNRNVIRLTCPRAERHYKSINFFVIDLGSIASGDLLADLVQFYKEEVSKQGTMRIVEESEESAPDGSPRALFRSEGQRGLLDIASRAYVGLHGPARTWGHIVTFTAGSEVFASFEPLGRHMADQLRYTGHA